MAPLLAALLWSAAAVSAGGPPVKVLGDAPPAPGKPDLHSQYNPCATSPDAFADADDDLLPDERSCAGVTRAHLKPKLAIEWDGGVAPGAVSKIWIDAIEVTFEVKQTISLSSRYAEGSCPYRVVFAHEQLHWKDNMELREKAVQGLLEDLAKENLPTKDRPTFLPHTQYAVDALEGQIVRRLRDVVKARQQQFFKEARAAVAKRDTRAEYVKNEWDKCPVEDWEPSLKF